MSAQHLPMGRIGGHRGLDVIRQAPSPELTLIEKRALHEIGNQGKPPPDGLYGVDLHGMNVTAIHNEAYMLDAMSGSGYAPELYDIGDDWSTQEDLGHTETPTDAEVWRQNLVRMLATIRAYGLRHGDLRGNNIITRGTRSWAVDWQESHHLGDVAPQKQPFADSALLMQHIKGTQQANGQYDTPRVARRWHAVLGALGATMDFHLPLKDKTLVDLGCFQGDFCALAASEGMFAVGVDQGGFQQGRNSIEIARALWTGTSGLAWGQPDHIPALPFGHVMFRQENILDAGDLYEADVVIMFSTWPYIVKDYGRRQADDLLRAIIQRAGVFFFETQLAGDGPGPDFLTRDEDVRDMLTHCGATKVQSIGTFDVTGRPAKRTVWKVQR